MLPGTDDCFNSKVSSNDASDGASDDCGSDCGSNNQRWWLSKCSKVATIAGRIAVEVNGVSMVEVVMNRVWGVWGNQWLWIGGTFLNNFMISSSCYGVGGEWNYYHKNYGSLHAYLTVNKNVEESQGNWHCVDEMSGRFFPMVGWYYAIVVSFECQKSGHFGDGGII